MPHQPQSRNTCRSPCISKLNPLSPYALSKICNEYFARIYSKKLNIEFIGFRFFNIFGKNQDHNSEYSSVILA